MNMMTAKGNSLLEGETKLAFSLVSLAAAEAEENGAEGSTEELAMLERAELSSRLARVETRMGAVESVDEMVGVGTADEEEAALTGGATEATEATEARVTTCAEDAITGGRTTGVQTSAREVARGLGGIPATSVGPLMATGEATTMGAPAVT